MRMWFHRFVTGFTEALVPTHQPAAGPAVVAAAAAFVCRQRERMPDYLRGPLLVLTALFDAWPFLRGRLCRFHALPVAERQRQIAAWRSSSLSFRRDLIKFYEGLAVFGLYSCREATHAGE